MQSTNPRIPPVSERHRSEEQKALIGPWGTMNFVPVIAQHPDLFRVLLPLIQKLIPGSNLPPRDREILVLRTLALCDETYELTHHVAIARSADVPEDIIETAQSGRMEDAFDQALALACEELLRDKRVSDEIWGRLSERYSQTQLMEVVALVGAYALMAMVTKSYDIQLEDPDVFDRLIGMRDYK